MFHYNIIRVFYWHNLQDTTLKVKESESRVVEVLILMSGLSYVEAKSLFLCIKLWSKNFKVKYYIREFNPY